MAFTIQKWTTKCPDFRSPQYYLNLFCRVIYKIVYPEDVLPELPTAMPALPEMPEKPAKRTALSGDTSDEDSYGECESPPQIPREMVSLKAPCVFLIAVSSP